MIAFLRQLNGAAVGFIVVVAVVGYCLSLRDPSGDVFAFTLIASLLCGALFGIPLGGVLSRRLPPWPSMSPAWRVLALSWTTGGVCLVCATYLWEPRLVPYLVVPLLVTPVELAALASRCRPLAQAALTFAWLGLVIFIVIQGFANRERHRVASSQLARPSVVPRPTPKPRPTPTADEHRSVLERCTLPTRADSDIRSPVVRALQRGNVLGRYPLEALAASQAPEARAYLAQQLASPTRHQETARALEFIKSRPVRR